MLLVRPVFRVIKLLALMKPTKSKFLRIMGRYYLTHVSLLVLKQWTNEHVLIDILVEWDLLF